ncbi:response regulator [Rhizobium leguminosarum bv. trifolii]|nr:response regulator [Rhizobium leguminosarum bv. trifolii]
MPSSGKQKHILVVDDDRNMREMVCDYLKGHFEVMAASDAKEAMRLTSRHLIDLAVVDLNLGKEDGLHVVKDLANQAIPVIIITGNRVDEADKVLGLEIGAVDYLTKPLSMREFLARIRSRLRQRIDFKFHDRAVSYSFADFEFKQRERRLQRFGRDEIKLSAGEYNVLAAFLRSPRKTLSRETLLRESRLRDEGVFDRTIDVLILRLRRKIEEKPGYPQLIKTVRYAGYLLDAEVVEKPDET